MTRTNSIRRTDPAAPIASVRVLVGAEAAYVCIKAGTISLDVRLAPGKSAAAAMRDRAEEMRREAQRLLSRASLIEDASLML